MKKYGVTVPIVGYSYVEVEAENQEEAEKKAIEEACNFEGENVDLQELYGVDAVVEGNVCNHPYWHIDSEELEDEQE